MSTLVFFLEEASAREMLQIIVPMIIPESIVVRYICFDGKQDLEKNIASKIKGWNTPDTVFLIMRDQDSGDCLDIKTKLLAKITKTGKSDCALVRIACCELESFYLGDLAAVESGMGVNGLSRRQGESKFRNPDMLSNPKQEIIRLTVGNYQAIGSARKISPHMNISGENRSKSFGVLLSGIRTLADKLVSV